MYKSFIDVEIILYGIKIVFANDNKSKIFEKRGGFKLDSKTWIN